MAPKLRSIATWTLTGLLAAFFLMSGYGKLTNAETAGGMDFDDQFEHWGLPAWFRFPVGLLEVAGAIGLLVPRLRFLAAGGLALLMVGAALTHVRIGEYVLAPIPLVLGLLAATLAWSTRPEWVGRRLRRPQSA